MNRRQPPVNRRALMIRPSSGSKGRTTATPVSQPHGAPVSGARAERRPPPPPRPPWANGTRTVRPKPAGAGTGQTCGGPADVAMDRGHCTPMSSTCPPNTKCQFQWHL